MTEEVKQLNNDEWPEGDERWTQVPTLPDPHREVPPRLFGRGECPFVPSRDYVLLWVKGIEFYTRSGLMVPTQTGGPRGYECPILTVIDAGPDVSQYKRGDTVLANPRNAEITYEWSDPEGLSTEHFLLVREENIIGHMDQEIVSQFSIRAQRCQAAMAKKVADEQRSEEVGLTVPDEKVILGPGGAPVEDPQND